MADLSANSSSSSSTPFQSKYDPSVFEDKDDQAEDPLVKINQRVNNIENRQNQVEKIVMQKQQPPQPSKKPAIEEDDDEIEEEDSQQSLKSSKQSLKTSQQSTPQKKKPLKKRVEQEAEEEVEEVEEDLKPKPKKKPLKKSAKKQEPEEEAEEEEVEEEAPKQKKSTKKPAKSEKSSKEEEAAESSELQKLKEENARLQRERLEAENERLAAELRNERSGKDEKRNVVLSASQVKHANKSAHTFDTIPKNTETGPFSINRVEVIMPNDPKKRTHYDGRIQHNSNINTTAKKIRIYGKTRPTNMRNANNKNARNNANIVQAVVSYVEEYSPKNANDKTTLTYQCPMGTNTNYIDFDLDMPLQNRTIKRITFNEQVYEHNLGKQDFDATWELID